MTHTTIVLLALAMYGAVAVDETPRVVDSRLQIECFAASPDIVTPTGIAVDGKGRVLAIESHTHMRPTGYQGPQADRIRVFEDTDGDGAADRITTFHEGTRHTMNLAVYHDGSVFVATRREIFRLFDDDEDGVADRRQKIAELDTPGDYPHNGLSGFAFDLAGNVYLGLGENLGAPYKLIGSDGTTLSGGGEGGSIYRCRADGSQLERIATGFWNPFHLAFDAFGHLFAVDNDPDARPPCRLLHIVDGGDYGYRFRNGRRGVHPFTAWNGELPGTLPMVAGTGEAPSGIVAYESDNLPEEYYGDLLGTSWGDHRIERYRLESRGASFGSRLEPLVVGGENFRPVGIVLAPDGSLYVSDWVDKSYELHGKGRIWRISRMGAKAAERPDDPAQALTSPHRPLREQAARRLVTSGEKGQAVLVDAMRTSDSPRVRLLAFEALAECGHEAGSSIDPLDESLPLALREAATDRLPMDDARRAQLADAGQPPLVRAAALRRMSRPDLPPALLNALDDADPFLRQAARQALGRSLLPDQELDITSLPTPGQRLGAALVLRNSNRPDAHDIVPTLMVDADPDIRFVAMQWIGEERLTEHRDLLVASLSRPDTTRRLFEAALAALEMLDGREPDDPSKERAGEEYVLALLQDEKISPELRRTALRAVRPDHPALTISLLENLEKNGDEAMRVEVIRTLRDIPRAGAAAALMRIAREAHSPVERAEAVMGLSAEDEAQRALLVELACDDRAELAAEALRSLRGCKLSLVQRDVLSRRAKSPLVPEAIVPLIERVLHPEPPSDLPSNDDIDAWAALLEGPADAEAGQRIFFHGRAGGCYHCHEWEGRGGRIGPDLSGIGRTLDRRRLIESIVQPAREIAPQYVVWAIQATDGRVFRGQYNGEKVDGTQHYVDADRKTWHIKPADIEQRRLLPESIMPEGLPAAMTVQELRDLLAFLSAGE